MSLSRSLGALGQHQQQGGGMTAVTKPGVCAIVNTKDDGAPYLRSEKMSPKSTVRGEATGVRPSPGGGYSPR